VKSAAKGQPTVLGRSRFAGRFLAKGGAFLPFFCAFCRLSRKKSGLGEGFSGAFCRFSRKKVALCRGF
jgi:hypothetical protein